MIDDLKEFIDVTEEAARSKAARHLNVSEDELDARVLPASLDIAGLGGRVIVLASVRRAPPVVGPLAEFVRGVVERMDVGPVSQVGERKSADETTVTVECAGLAALARDESGLLAALGHLAQRIAQKQAGSEEEPRVRVELGGRGPDRGGRGRGRDRGDRGDRGRDGRRDRGRGRDRGGRGDRERDRDRGGRGRGRGPREASESGEGDPENPELERRALETGRRVLETGQPATLDEMSSRDRWIVHNALKELEGIESESVGDGRMKRVKIFPA